MKREEYERARQRILEERAAALELMETAYDAQLRALELVWTTHGQGGFTPAILRRVPESAPPPPPAPPPPRRASRFSPEELENRILEALDRLPDPFDRNEVCKALGLPLDRGLLYRALRRLADDGILEILDRGKGRSAALYRKSEHYEKPPEHSAAGAEHSAAPAEHDEAPREHDEDPPEHSEPAAEHS